MGFYVHVSVIFHCDINDPVAEAAKKHLPGLESEEKDNLEAKAFLESLSCRTGGNPGPKGGLSLWGTVGNYANVAEFVDVLRPFWMALFRDCPRGGPLPFEHILVFGEREQSEQAEAWEICYNEGIDGLEIKHHLCPFAWMQM